MMAALLLLLLLTTCRTSVRSRASVTVSPNQSQFFEYDEISVSCEQFGSGGWAVWRYTTNSSEQVLSQCGVGWGKTTSSTCNIKTAKLSDSGVYWCQNTHGDCSNTVNITVTGGAVILQSPVLPVMEGDDVTLRCQSKTPPSNLAATFYKDGSLIRSEPTGHMTIHHVSRSDESAYTCHTNDHRESPPSWLLIKDDSDPVSLTPTPESSQLFEYARLSLSCGNSSRLHGWSVISAREQKQSLQRCGVNWGTWTDFGCVLQTAKVPDSGIYWCESPAKQRSNSVNISVYGGAVILQSPVLPVMEGDDVTLSCQSKTPPSNLTTNFYKDGSLIRTEPTGHMTIHHVSRSDEGLYKCHMSSGESPPSWLFVRGAHGTAPTTADPTLSVWRLISLLVVVCPYCISTVLMVGLYRQRPAGNFRPDSLKMTPRHKDDVGLDQPYDDVIADVTTEHQF